MTAIHRRNEQNQLNVPATEALLGYAGRVVKINGRPIITIEDVTPEMIAGGNEVGIATSGVWTIPKASDVEFEQFENVFVDLDTQIAGKTGVCVGIAEKPSMEGEPLVYVRFDFNNGVADAE